MTNNKKPTWTKISIRQPINDLRQHGPSFKVGIAPAGDAKLTTVFAQIDTGAGGTAISPRIAQRLAIQPIDRGTIQQAGLKPIVVAVYRIHLSLPPLFDIDLEVTGLPFLSAPHDVLIGRDLLTDCQLGVDFTTGRTWLHIKSKS